jgi:hypothetical protein
MLDATTRRETGLAMSCCRRTAVPNVFVEVYDSTSYMLCPTPT